MLNGKQSVTRHLPFSHYSGLNTPLNGPLSAPLNSQLGGGFGKLGPLQTASSSFGWSLIIDKGALAARAG
jgi:hypothetical protein